MAESSSKRRGKRQIRETPFLPEDITTDIFTRLPVKSLLRFRCLSKPFRALIDSPDFIKRQLNRSLLTKTNHKLILQQFSHMPTRIYSVDLYKPKQALELDHPFIKSQQPYMNIIGSVNGLLCLSNEKDDLVIWNFATGNYQKVPANEIELPYKCYAEVAYGFGYDSLLDEYKLLRLVRLNRGEPSSVKFEAKVYSLRSNSWLRVGDCPYTIRLAKSGMLLVCGALHWATSHGSAMTHSIAAFDLVTNECKLLDIPEFLRNKSHVTKLEGCLCLVSGWTKFHFWVMKDYGVKESWCKLFSISIPDVIPKYVSVNPLAYSKGGTEIMLFQNREKLFWYSLKEERVRTIRIRGRPGHFFPEICVESLVPLGGKAKDYAKKNGGKDAKEQINGAKKSTSVPFSVLGLSLCVFMAIWSFPFYYGRFKH